MLIVFVHGWSVKNTHTYRGLPEALAKAAKADGLDVKIQHVFLGRYISFHDEVTVYDIARAFDTAIRRDIPANKKGERRFACVTHSTGGPVIREWVRRYYKNQFDDLPLSHLVMLAPANHGSALAQLGKSRLSRIKTWFQGIEPGKSVLDWLELGSQDSMDLAEFWLDADPVAAGFYPFVFVGQSIYKKFYDHLNSYTGEEGSDGVVRVATANMNYSWVSLEQTDRKVTDKPTDDRTFLDVVKSKRRRAPDIALQIVAGRSHSGKVMGIMNSVRPGDTDDPVIRSIVQALKVKSSAQYRALRDEFKAKSDSTQTAEIGETPRCSMLVFTMTDDEGNSVTDFDMLLLAGKDYDPDDLPKGFFIDRQMNSRARNHLVYYLNHDRLMEADHLGFRIVARPQEGFSRYQAAEFRSEDAKIPIQDLFSANETLYVDIVMKRRVDRETFRLGPARPPHGGFQRQKTSDEVVD